MDTVGEIERVGPEHIRCSRPFLRELIIVTHWGDADACLKDLFNNGFRGADLRLPKDFGVGRP